MNEPDLLAAYRDAGSEQAFAILIRHYTNLVFSIARRRLGNGALAEDVTQTVFTRLAKAPPKIRHQAELTSWLHRTTVHVSIDLWRTETRRRAREQQAATMQSTVNEETRVWEELTPQLDGALDELTEADRQAVLLRFFESKPMREIGQMLGVSEDAAKMRVSRAIERLRKQLASRGVTCTAVILGTVLAQRAVEAAPGQLAASLTALNLSTAAATSGGLIATLSQLLRSKAALGATAILAIVLVVAWLWRSGNIPETNPITTEVAAEPPPVSAKTNSIPAKQSARIASASDPEPANIRFKLQVVDAATEVGLPDAKISVAYFYAGGVGEGHDLTTDANGEARIPLPNKPGGSGPNVFVSKDHYVPRALGWGTTIRSNYTMRLDPALTAEGVVVDESGQPVAGVKMKLQGPGNRYGEIDNVDFQTVPLKTDPQGRWRMTYIPKDMEEIRFDLSKDGYATTHVIIPPTQNDFRNLTLMIDSGLTVSGQITDTNGQPVVGAKVSEFAHYTRPKQSTQTDKTGMFTLTGLAPQSASFVPRPIETNTYGAVRFRGMTSPEAAKTDLIFEAKGFASHRQTVALSEATNRFNLTLLPSLKFRGRVVDEHGDPISGAAVRTDSDIDRQGDYSFSWLTHTDVQGRFEWDGAPRERMCYWFEAPGFVVIRDLPLLADGREHEIKLKRDAKGNARPSN